MLILTNLTPAERLAIMLKHSENLWKAKIKAEADLAALKARVAR